MPDSEPNLAGDGRFQPTHWSLVLAANEATTPQAEEALEQLCREYWRPIFTFIRRRGYDFEAAKDLTQEFFARLLAKQYLRVADRERGRFRTFLITCVDHFLCNEYKKDNTLKRGGALTILSLESVTSETGLNEPAGDLSPDRLLDRNWGLTVLELALKALREEYVASGRSDLFEALQVHLSGAREASCSFADLGPRLNLSETAVRKAASRMRERFGQLLRKTVAQTVANPSELEAEMIHLRTVLSAS